MGLFGSLLRLREGVLGLGDGEMDGGFRFFFCIWIPTPGALPFRCAEDSEMRFCSFCCCDIRPLIRLSVVSFSVFEDPYLPFVLSVRVRSTTLFLLPPFFFSFLILIYICTNTTPQNTLFIITYEYSFFSQSHLYPSPHHQLPLLLLLLPRSVQFFFFHPQLHTLPAVSTSFVLSRLLIFFFQQILLFLVQHIRHLLGPSGTTFFFTTYDFSKDTKYCLSPPPP